MSKQDLFVILALDSTGDMHLWWRERNAGYTISLEEAGRYTGAQVEAAPHYYNDGKDNIAVPVAVAMRESIRVVQKDSAVTNLFKCVASRMRVAAPAPSPSPAQGGAGEGVAHG